MGIDSSIINNYKYLAQSFCEPDFTDYYLQTGLTREDWLDNKRAILFLEKYSFINRSIPPEWILSKERVFNLPFKKEDYL